MAFSAYAEYMTRRRPTNSEMKPYTGRNNPSVREKPATPATTATAPIPIAFANG